MNQCNTSISHFQFLFGTIVSLIVATSANADPSLGSASRYFQQPRPGTPAPEFWHALGKRSADHSNTDAKPSRGDTNTPFAPIRPSLGPCGNAINRMVPCDQGLFPYPYDNSYSKRSVNSNANARFNPVFASLPMP